LGDELELDRREVEWPPPREDPPEERSHRAARIADRERGVELGDVADEEADDGTNA
jgi:hypothetical protein